jgi:flagellar hook-associated protein 1 FlgK
MPSTFSGIEIGKRSLITHTIGLHTIGHNISNADVDGYSRQRVEMEPSAPLYLPGLSREERPGQLGQGVEIDQIIRIKDMLLEGRIVAKTNEQGYWETRDMYLSMLEDIHNEPLDNSVRTALQEFWMAWQNLSIYPTEIAARNYVLETGQTLISAIHNQYEMLKGVRDMLNDDIIGTVKEINTLVQNIAALNEQIVKIKAMGDNPNDLLDRRDLLVNELSRYIDITISEKDPDEFIIYTGGVHLVQGKEYRQFMTVPNNNNEGYVDVYWSDLNEEAYFRGGTLFAQLELRDVDVRMEIQNLDMLTINFTDLVNEVHRNAYGLTNQTGIDFFVEYPFVINQLGNYDRNEDGVFDSTYIFRVTGTEILNPNELIGLEGTITLSGPAGNIDINYYATDTVDDLIDRINNSGAEVVARLDQKGHLELKGMPTADSINPDFVIRHIGDSGQFLVGYAGLLRAPGPLGAFDWGAADQIEQFVGGNLSYAVAPLTHPSGWIEINPELFKEPMKIATSFDPASGGPSDGAAALVIAQLQTKPAMIGQNATFDDFFAQIIGNLGSRGKTAEINLISINKTLEDLNEMKSSISGVNIDEELAQMIKYQHGYNAAARFISTIDSMLDIIINRMAV